MNSPNGSISGPASRSEPASPTVRPSIDSQTSRVRENEKTAHLHEDIDVVEYPEGLKLFLITIALCLSVFLVALVSQLQPGSSQLLTDVLKGQYHYSYGNTQDYRSVQVAR